MPQQQPSSPKGRPRPQEKDPGEDQENLLALFDELNKPESHKSEEPRTDPRIDDTQKENEGSQHHQRQHKEIMTKLKNSAKRPTDEPKTGNDEGRQKLRRTRGSSIAILKEGAERALALSESREQGATEKAERADN